MVMFLWELKEKNHKEKEELRNKLFDNRIEILEKIKVDLAKKIEEKFKEDIVIPYGSYDWLSRVYPIIILRNKELLRELVLFLKNELNFNYLNYITAVDYPLHNLIHVIYEFTSIPIKSNVDELAVEYSEYKINDNLILNNQYTKRIRIVVVLDRDNVNIDSIADIFDTSDWHERETYDFFGIIFKNRPVDRPLKRILMPDEWEGFPLRKDFFHERIIPHPFSEAYYVVKKVKELTDNPPIKQVPHLYTHTKERKEINKEINKIKENNQEA
jgi:NADH-quinone oxidoreductase subunit C